MSHFKRNLEDARDAGYSAYMRGDDRDTNPEVGVPREYWFEGYDYAADCDAMSEPPTDMEIDMFFSYAQDPFVGETF